MLSAACQPAGSLCRRASPARAALKRADAPPLAAPCAARRVRDVRVTAVLKPGASAEVGAAALASATLVAQVRAREQQPKRKARPWVRVASDAGCVQASVAADLDTQGGVGASLSAVSLGESATVEGVWSSLVQAGFTTLDACLAALALTFALLAATASADKARLSAAADDAAKLQKRVSAAEAAVLAERAAAQQQLSARNAEVEAEVASAVAAALQSEGARLRSEAVAAAAAQAAAEGLMSAAQAEEVRAAVDAAREELTQREKGIQAKANAIEAKTNAIAKRLLQERDTVSARVMAAEAERAAAVRELELALEALGEARARASAAEEAAKQRSSP